MKTLYLDIETRAAVVSTWGLFNQNIGIGQVQIPTSMICFAAKWADRKTVEFYSDFHNGHDEMVKQAHRLLDEADVLVTWNGRSFDEKHLNREIMEAGLTPPSPYKSLDLMLSVRKKFRFLSNKLAWVSQRLELDGKLDTGGFALWDACLAGDAGAWAKMRRYNKRDVTLLQEIHDRIRPWIDSHPNVALYDGVEGGCPNCGGVDLQSRGFARTRQGSYRRYQCGACGKWTRGTVRVDGATRVEVAS